MSLTMQIPDQLIIDRKKIIVGALRHPITLNDTYRK